MIWKERYKIGVPLIDEQHEELFRRVTAFVETLRSPAEWSYKADKVSETLDFMKDYVVTHFHDEEAYQREVGYPDYEAHRKLHNDMVQYVASVAKEFENDPANEKLMQQFAGKLLAWLINHVAATDQKIAVYTTMLEEGRRLQ